MIFILLPPHPFLLVYHLTTGVVKIIPTSEKSFDSHNYTYNMHKAIVSPLTQTSYLIEKNQVYTRCMNHILPDGRNLDPPLSTPSHRPILSHPKLHVIIQRKMLWYYVIWLIPSNSTPYRPIFFFEMNTQIHGVLWLVDAIISNPRVFVFTQSQIILYYLYVLYFLFHII